MPTTPVIFPCGTSIEKSEKRTPLLLTAATCETVSPAAGFDEEKSRKVLRACELVIYVDTHVTEKDFPGVGQALETLAAYFVKGLF